MAKKDNLKCIRLSDEMVEVIETQQGQNFSQKFENLVTRCMWELPAKERDLRRVDQQLNKKRNELIKMQARVAHYQERLKTFDQLFDYLSNTFDELSRSHLL